MAADRFRNLLRTALALERDVLVLSVAMLLFSLSFQMTSRYVPRYMQVLGAGAGAIGLFGSATNLLSALYPYPGGAISDRFGSRAALTLFGLASTLGFVVWLFAEWFGTATVAPPALPVVEVYGQRLGGRPTEPLVLPIGIFLGLALTQAWKSLGLGATFAVVKQSAGQENLATGFASTETFRRIGFLVGPLLAAGVLAIVTDFAAGFEVILAIAAGFALVGTVAQHVLYDPSADTVGSSFGGLAAVREDLRSMPDPLRPLLVGDTLVRFANGMVYVFFVIVVTDYLAVGFSLFGWTFSPEAFFGVLLAIEMVVALVTMIPVGRIADRYGHKPVVALGFSVYAIFPVLLIGAPADAAVLVVLFAFSGLRFAGLPAHRALIVGPAEAGAGGRVTGTYYLLRNTVVIPSAALGGFLYAQSPEFAFATATAIGLLGTGYFLAFGEELA
ncbi:MAG: MFS transporter [Halanaeroarchaeum sp.]